MTTRQVGPHWLRENARERSPHRVLVFDTETDMASELDPARQVLRLWSATLVRRHGIDPRKPRRETFRGRTADELRVLVDSLARADATLWAYAHNLNFDLAVTELPVVLADAGWRLTEAALTTDSPWCRMARGSRRLVIADSSSLFPTSVLELGKVVGLPKLRLPEAADTDDAWWARCDRDVAIVVRALVSALDWWDDGHYGNWSLTGPATGWSSYRHRRPAPRVLIVPDERDRAFEMAAVTGGRREVRRLGRQPAGLYADLDLTTAHLTAMAGLALPMQRLLHFDRLDPDDRALSSTIRDVMAVCEVETSSPRYPWDSGHGILYPVGRFHAQLAGPELREAIARSELRSIGRGIVYLTDPHMAEWALWVASLLDERSTDVPPSARILAKHWSRCVPGKWAGHTSEVVERVPDARPGWMVERAVLMPQRRSADLLTVGGECWTILRDLWADDAFPAILAWIQSATRVAVSRLADMLGPAVVAMNTDGVLADVGWILDQYDDPDRSATAATLPQLRELDRVLAMWDDALAPFSVRIKQSARKVAVWSPQHLELDGVASLAGIPRRAVKLADGRYTFTQWPKLRVQLTHPEGPGYRTADTTVGLPHIPPGGWLLESGRVVPPVVIPDGQGGDRVATVDRDDWHPDRLQPPERQHAALRPVMAAARL